MSTVHPLRQVPVVRVVERAATAHLGRAWVAAAFTDLSDRASHPCGVFRGDSFSVFAKLDDGPQGFARFTAELRGLAFLRAAADAATPNPVADGVFRAEAGALLVLEAVEEIPAEARSSVHWRSIGRALAATHQVQADEFGLRQFDGSFGPLRQDNRPVESTRWADFHAERRLLPYLRSAADSGHLPADLARGVERIVDRLPSLCGPEPEPSLLHGDAQQNNFLTTAEGAVMVDACPYFGHPEVDLALVDFFAPVPDAVFDGYREIGSIDPGFPRRRELWRLHASLAGIAVAGETVIGRSFLRRVGAVVAAH